MNKTSTTQTARHFTYSEAKEKAGKKVRSKNAFSKVPVGTTGVVLDPYFYEKNKEIFDPNNTNGRYLLPVKWELSDFPIVDWFTKDEYEDSLEELQGTVSKTGVKNKSNTKILVLTL